jgi:hypothetical protein
MATLPNFFILGSAKCGTTSLYHLLRAHPEVFLPVVKEPEFFSNDLHFSAGIDAYSRTHFRGAESRAARGDATPHYIAFEKVARRIKDLIPEEGHRFILILRDPVERAYSLYWNLVYEGHETLDFEEALEREDERSRDPELDRMGLVRFRYFSSGLYGAQLEAYLRYFSRERFLILLQEDLRRDPKAVIQRICGFLGISPDYELPEEVGGNPAGRARSKRLHGFLRNSHWIKEPLKALIPHELKHRILQRLFEWNKRAEAYPPLEPRVADALRERYREDLNLLMELSGLELSHWLRRDPGAE